MVEEDLLQVQPIEHRISFNASPGIPMDFCLSNSTNPCTFPLYRILPCTIKKDDNNNNSKLFIDNAA